MYFYYFILILGVVFNVLAQVTLKTAMKTPFFIEGTDLISKIRGIITNFYLIGAVMLYGLGFIAYALALSKLDLSKAYPAASVLAIVFTVLISVVFMGEAANFTKLFGVAICIIGLLIIFK